MGSQTNRVGQREDRSPRPEDKVWKVVYSVKDKHVQLGWRAGSVADMAEDGVWFQAPTQ